MSFRLLRPIKFHQISYQVQLSKWKNEERIICGPEPHFQIPKISLGKKIFDNLSKLRSSEPILINAATNEKVSAQEILQKSIFLAQKIKKSDLGKKSLVAVCDDNLDVFVPIIGCLFIGQPVTFINPVLSCMEKIHCFNLTKPELVFTSEEFFDEMEALRTKFSLDFIKQILVIDSEMEANGDVVANIEPQETALVLFTSGTTGLPKRVDLTHSNIIAKILNYKDPRFFSQKSRTPILAVLPFSHGYTLILGLSNLIRGNSVVLLKSNETDAVLNAIQFFKVKKLCVGPYFLRHFAESLYLSKHNLESLKEISSSGGFVSPCIEAKIKKRFPKICVGQIYSSTETGIVLMNDFKARKCGCCGTVVPHMCCKVVDSETSENVGPFVVGELCFKGPLCSSEGWYYTGDLGYYDEDKSFYYVERAADVIKYDNSLVAPGLIEDILRAHPEIDDAGVVAIPCGTHGQRPFAFIAKSPNSGLCENDVIKYQGHNMVSCLKLSGGVAFITKIPRNSFGKIRRYELRRFWEMLHQKRE